LLFTARQDWKYGKCWSNYPHLSFRRLVISTSATDGLRVTLRRALSPTFPAGELVFFIPWRVVAAIPARRISTCSGRLVGAAAGGRTMVKSPPAATSF